MFEQLVKILGPIMLGYVVIIVAVQWFRFTRSAS